MDFFGLILGDFGMLWFYWEGFFVNNCRGGSFKKLDESSIVCRIGFFGVILWFGRFGLRWFNREGLGCCK